MNKCLAPDKDEKLGHGVSKLDVSPSHLELRADWVSTESTAHESLPGATGHTSSRQMKASFLPKLL